MRDTDKIVNLRSDADLIVGTQERRNKLHETQALFDDDPVFVEPHDGLEAVKATSPCWSEVRTPVTPDTPELDTRHDSGSGFRHSRNQPGVESVPDFSAPTQHQNHKRKNMTDPIIAIVGTTGAGKSSLIDSLGGLDESGGRPCIGRNLKSCTRAVTWYQATVNGQSVQLLDTPGFDDITMSDSEILQAIATELAGIYQSNRSLNGLVYVYDVSKTRYGRQSTKNLQMFQQLVGEESLKNVLLVTTHWDTSNPDHIQREKELESEYWRNMILYGSRIARHDGSRESAATILQSLVTASPTVVKVVNELVQQGLSFEQTAVGKTVNEALEGLKAQMQEDLSAVTIQLQRLEEQRTAEAEQARKEKTDLEERYRKATEESNRKAMDAFAQLRQQLEAEKEARDAKLSEKEEHAMKEREEYKALLKEAIERQDRMKEVLTKKTVAPIPPPKSTSLYFRYPGYRLLDWVAWLAWACSILQDIALWAATSIAAGRDENGFVVWAIITIPWIVGTVLFGRTFFNSKGPESLGLCLLVTNFAFRIFIVFGSVDDEGVLDMIFWQLLCVGIVGFRYVIGSP